MFFVFLSLLFFALILIILNPKSQVFLWLSAFSTAAALGILSIDFPEIYNVLFNNNVPLDYLQFKYIRDFLLSVSNSFMPYTLLVFSILYSEIPLTKNPKSMNALKLVLSLPLVLMYLYCLNNSGIWTVYSLFQGRLYIIWSILYYLCSCVFIIYAYLCEKDKRKKLANLMLALVIIPIVIETLILGYVLPLNYYPNATQLYFFIVPLQILAIIIVSLKYGFLGIKLNIEKNYLDGTITSIKSGTTLINHSLKNDLSKVNLCIDNIRTNPLVNEDPSIHRNIDVIQNSVNHMMTLVDRIQECMQDIKLSERRHNLTRIIEDSLQMLTPHLESSDLIINKRYHSNVELICDDVHLKEVFVNIIKNAIEAMPHGGTLDIETSEKNKGVAVSIKDTGAGILKEDLPYVMNPFFTTKKQKLNFGLGLSYCYNVMQKLGGAMDINSESSIGTTVSLYFPSRKIVSSSKSSYKGAVVNE